MARTSRRVPVRLVAVAAAGVALAGCNSMTYGTGTTPAMQTVQDLTGIATGAAAQKDAIDYTPRPKIVAPPSVAALPPPVDDSQITNAANWPNDPDQLKAKVKADAEARAAAGKPDDLRLPQGTVVATAGGERTLSKAELDEVRRQMQASKGGMSVDANGNPVRKYLTDPPVDYRVPDPNAPVVVAEDGKPKKKKWKWWWQN